MAFTREEQLWLAEKLRESKNLPQMLPENYLDCLNEVSMRELFIPTIEGESHCYLTKPLCGAKNDVLIINIHGGGFVQQHYTPDKAICAIYALELGCAVLDIDYRTAPEDPYPAAMNECYDVLQWCVRNAGELGISPDKIVASGNSAGAVLAANTAMLSAERGGAAPAMLVMLYPAADMRLDPALADYNGRAEDLDLTDLSTRCSLYTRLYTNEDAPLADDGHICLNNATAEQLSKFPETLVLTAGTDPLRPDGEQFALRILESGSAVTLKCYRDSAHGFYVRCIGPDWYDARNFVMAHICRKFGIEHKVWRKY